MPPEWLETTSAPPAGGMFSTFRTSARNHRLITGPTAFAICLVNAGSHLAISCLSAVWPFMVPRSLSVSLLHRRDAGLPTWTPRRYDIRYSQFTRMSYPQQRAAQPVAD